MFVVFQEGVYRHKCGGVFSTEQDAKEAAEFLAHNDDDDYHTWEVREFLLDQIVNADEELVLWVCQKGKEPSDMRASRYADQRRELKIKEFMPLAELDYQNNPTWARTWNQLPSRWKRELALKIMENRR